MHEFRGVAFRNDCHFNAGVVDPVTGGPVYRTMTFFVQLLRGGEALLPQRQNANRIVTVFEGNGHSVVGDRRFEWEPFDTFCVSGGEWRHHVNAAPGSDAVLFVSSDEPPPAIPFVSPN